ncbi:hypothetical protein MMC28_001699 [Mycoblastus sanguinarius]|nr:hypothetical protein [Mycoblastus sanguinarius]
MTAARLLLDEEHETLPARYRHSRDSNIYHLRRIQQHNVVIACLPEEYGSDSAAVVAQQMLYSFAHIRFGLLVGVGGGVPSPRNDIRLRDVVVGRPLEGTGDVIQFDFGKRTGDGKFHRIRHLDQPPRVLLSALSIVRSNREMKEGGIIEYLANLFSRGPDLLQ